MFKSVRAPKVGDLALHKAGLDGRIVDRVTTKSDSLGTATFVYLRFDSGEHPGVYGPFPARNYRFKREVKKA